MRHGLTVVITLAIAGNVGVLTPASATERSFPSTAAAAQQAIEDALAATGATSVTAGLTDLNGLVWQGTAGVIDADGPAPGPTTQYGIGSTSKMFATAAVMQLVDAGLVGLDQPVVRYLPQFTMRSPQYRQITVRMLLDHSAGLPGTTYTNIFTTQPYDGYADGMLATLERSRLKTTPGAMSVYCNDCFTLAGELVAAVSGMPFTEYVERHLLSPLGMTDSQYVTDRMPRPGTVARTVSGGRTQPLEVTNAYASGGLMSTAADVLSFARMLLARGQRNGGTLLSSTSIAEMGRSQLGSTLDPVTRSPWAYGLGWDSVRNLSLAGVGVRAWVKGGDTADFHAGLIVAPEAGLAAFVAGAGTFSSSSAEAAAEQILLSALVERGDIPAMPERLGTQQPAPATPTENDINAMVGTYLGAMGLAYRLSRGPGATLVLESIVEGAWQPHPDTLTYRADGAWWPDTPKAQSLRTVTGWGRTYLVMSMPNGYGNTYGEEVLAQRVQPSGPTARPWRNRLGQWLPVAELPISTAWLRSPAVEISALPDLPGFIEVSAASPVDALDADVASMFLQIPLMWGRDLDDLEAMPSGMLRMGGSVMLDRDEVPSLAAGRSTIVIGSRGYARWREIEQTGRLSVTGADAWFLYDADLRPLRHGTSDAADLRAPSGAMLVVFGSAADVVDVRVR